MRATLVLIPVFGPLAVLAANVERGLERDIHDGPVAPTPDPFDGGTGLYQQWPQLGSVPVNRTVGSTRSGKRHLSSLLEARQNSVCLDPGFVLVCPTTDPYPCCDPKYPICCHTATCCPTGTFCVGKSTCCQLGTVACGEGCCPSGTKCCGTNCCTTGYTCTSGQCQNLSAGTSTSFQDILPTNALPSGTNVGFTATSAQTSSANNNSNNSPNNAAVIGGAVGGAIGGVVLIGGCIAAWYFYSKAHAATTIGSASAGAAQSGGYGSGTAGALGGSPSVGQPLMTSTSMPFTPTAAGAGSGLAAQPVFGVPGVVGAPGSPIQPSTPSNGTDYSQLPVSHYPQGAYGAAAPPSSASGSVPWAGGQAYGQPGGFVAPEAPGSPSHPGYYTGTPAPSGSTYGGMAAEPMQAGQGAQTGFDSSLAYARTPSSPGPQVQTWVERSGER